MGFDIDSCAVGFDGVRVYAHPRAARALKYQFNLVDMSRRSPTYEQRLFKYSRRGFCVAVPGLDRSRISQDLLINYWRRKNAKGLAKLIVLEYNTTRRETRFWNTRALSKTFDIDKKDVHEEASYSDYANIHIPYGPKWSADGVLGHLRMMNERANDWYYRICICNPPRAESVVCLCGTIDEVLGNTISSGDINGKWWDNDEEEYLVTFKHVVAAEMWLTDNPGSQTMLTGSFHPLTNSVENWEIGAYDKKRT